MAKSQPDIERRRNLRLLRYWEELRGERLFPCETAIDPNDIADMWENCFLLQVRDIEQVEDYNFTYLGGGIIEAYADGLLNKDKGRLLSPNARKLSHHFEDVIRSKKPYMEDDAFTSARGNHIVYRQCILPLGPTDDKVEALFGGMFFKKK